MNKHTFEMLARLQSAGISTDDAYALRRIAMTLHRWHELECGDSNAHCSWAIERDDNGDGPPFMVTHYHAAKTYAATVAPSRSPQVKPEWTRRHRIPDREAGARKRLAAILKRYPGLQAYVQTDPRGAALYILRPGDVREGADVSCCYSNGIAVYK